MFEISNINWEATGAMLSGWATLFGAGAVVYAAHKGSDTFKQWRRQKSEERRIELAEQLLTLGYKSKRAIQGIRSPGLFGWESAEVEAKLRENGTIDDTTPEGKKGLFITAQATLSRAEHYKELWEAIETFGAGPGITLSILTLPNVATAARPAK